VKNAAVFPNKYFNGMPLKGASGEQQISHPLETTSSFLNEYSFNRA